MEGDFRRTKSWRKKFKKEKTSRDKSRKEETPNKHYSIDSDSSYQLSNNSEVTSPTRRLTKSPIIGKRYSK